MKARLSILLLLLSAAISAGPEITPPGGIVPSIIEIKVSLLQTKAADHEDRIVVLEVEAPVVANEIALLETDVLIHEERITTLENATPPLCFKNIYLYGAYLMDDDGNLTDHLIFGYRTSWGYIMIRPLNERSGYELRIKSDGTYPGFSGSCLIYPL